MYPLRGETLEPGSSRGVSNVFAASEARISVDDGVLLAIRPGASRSDTSCRRALPGAPDRALLAVAGCGGGDEPPSDVVLVTHDSFAISPDVKKAFEQESGLKLRILKAGDAGEVVTRALLTAGNPEGDVLFGVDNNLLQRALDGDVFEPYESPGSRASTPRLGARSRAPRDADRPRRRLPQLRQGVVRGARHRAARESWPT